MVRILGYISGLLGITLFFGTPLIYIYNEHMGEVAKRGSFIWLSIAFIILLFITVLAIKFIFSINGIYQIKLIVFTMILMLVLLSLYKLFDYIELNAGDIKRFLLLWITSIFTGYILMIPFIHRLKLDKLIK